MNLQIIRERILANGCGKQTLRQVWLEWLTGNCGDLCFDTGLTIMPTKVFWKNANGKDVYRHLSKAELEKANARLVMLLNKLVYKEGYKRFNKRLDVVAVIEGEREQIDLHTHIAIKRPADMQTNEFARRVLKALQLSGEFEIENKNYNADRDCIADKFRYKLDIIDSGWLSYITKTLSGKEFSNLYLL